jgi:hypothetical protein
MCFPENQLGKHLVEAASPGGPGSDATIFSEPRNDPETDPHQTAVGWGMGIDHADLHSQFDLPRISQKLRVWHAFRSLIKDMRDQRKTTPYLLAAIGIAIAVWVTMGSPPKAHPVSGAYQFADSPSLKR